MNWKENFLNPPRQYGIYPIIHGGMVNNCEKILNQENSKNWGGVVANINYTPDFPNNKKEWENFEKSCRRFIENGYKVWIYDEKGYPSGTAGGAVLENNPEFEAIGLICYNYFKTITKTNNFRADTPDGKLYKAFLVRLDSEQEAIDITNTANANGTLYFSVPNGKYRLIVFVERTLFDSTHASCSYSEPRRYIDLFDANATKAFIACTYEKYAERLDDMFGKEITAFFTDEPSLIGWNIPGGSYPLISWSRIFPQAFEKKFGYPVEKALIAVCTGTGPHKTKRCCDFWELTAELVSQNYFKVLNEWCKAHNTNLTGHLLNEENLIEHIFNYGSLYRSLKQFNIPGVDILSSDPKDLMNHSSIPIARLVGSVADVFNLKEAMNESSFHIQYERGQEFKLDWVISTVNYQFALGVNNLASYYGISTFSDEEFKNLNQYFARIGYLIRGGKRINRVAVLYPEYSMYDLFKPNANPRNSGQCDELHAINNCFCEASWQLLNRQIDFDYLDEEELLKSTIKDAKLFHTHQNYDTLILPCAHILKADTFDLIERFVLAGGKVIILDRMPEFQRESGKESKSAKKLEQFKNDGKILFDYSKSFKLAAKALPRNILLHPTKKSVKSAKLVGDEYVSYDILSHFREDKDKTIIFLCNMSDKDYTAKMEIPSAKSATLADNATGICSPLKIKKCSGKDVVDITISAYRGIFIILNKNE